MRHKKLSRRFSRTSSHRQAMMRNLAISIIEHEIIKTTVEKGKELRRFLEPLITKSKSNNLHSRRIVLSKLGSKDAVKKMFNDLGPRFADINGGYLRIIKAGFREGDKADMCYIELTKRIEVSEVGEDKENLEKQSVDIIEDDSKLTPTESIEGQQEITEKTPKKTAAKKPTAKKPAAKEDTPKKTAAKKPTAKKPAAKKPAAKEDTPKKTAAKKSTAKKDEPKGNWWSRFLK
jgi:large subunit ribosomal protein L17